MEQIFPKLVTATRAAAGLAANDVKFFKALDSQLATQSDEVSGRLVKLINEFTDEDFNGDTIKESWKTVSNLLDNYLETADIAFDELKGKKSTDIVVEDVVQDVKKIEKPQALFKVPVDNSESHPFKPKLTSKPHSIVPFEDVFILTDEEENIPSHYKQPYMTEILNSEYNEEVLIAKDPIPFTDWEQTDAIWVDSVDELKKMITELSKATAIAVDLEHHDYRSYYGIVCLMQISTRTQDWIIDTIALRDDLEPLNVVFTNPYITKVFHGAFMDIIWLQRDLGLYIVSLFDTYHASRSLGFPKHSLAYLLETYAHFKTSKKYQLADWRIRPLTKPMKLYARADTHFLLNIYDQLRNMLIEQGKMDTVLYESRNVASRRFEYSKFRPKISTSAVVSPIEKQDPWKSLLYQYNLPQSKAMILEALYYWRDDKAREEDESPRYIMPNQLLITLTSLSPTEPFGVLSSSNSLTESVRKNCKVIAEVISKALERSEVEDFKLYDLTEKTIKEEDLTIESVLKNQQLFIQFVQGNNEADIKFNEKSSLFSREMIDDSVKLYSIEKSNLPYNERASLVETRLNTTNVARLTEPNEEAEGTEAQPDVNAKGEDDDDVKEEEITEEAMFDDKDDIVVLRNKQHQKQQQKQKKETEDEKNAFDYSKADRVIQAEQQRMSKKERNEKKRSSTTFDPYTLESEGPRPAKKQNILRAGKTSSFVQKKKKK